MVFYRKDITPHLPVGEETRVPEQQCPVCGEVLDAASSTCGSKPSEGDATVCLGCGHLMAFRADFTLRELTEKERSDIQNHPQFKQIQQARSKLRRH